ncbi:MAG: FecR domain-containing protein [Nitrosomonadales bacterium]|nr:FecR domain-containing protein [Nitrosomonadales bacterium]
MNLLIALCLLMLVTATQAAQVAGKVGYMNGTLVAQRTDGTVMVLGPKSEVLAGDMLITAKDSYAQVQMNDGATMTLRPNSNLKIEAYQFNKEEPKADNVILRLLKGGFRTVTGLIGKRGNADAYKLHAASATIGIRGTDFSSRLCATKDCKDDGDTRAEKTGTKQQSVASAVVGRVMLVQGELSARESAGKESMGKESATKENASKERKLVLGAPVYEGDTLTTGKKSYAVVAFRDESRVTLQEGTVFNVEKFKYDKAASQENAVLRLLKGGVRVVTGWIGRVNHDNYQFRVASATIGIRGTGFDAWCNGPCARGDANPVASTGPQESAAGPKSLWSQYAEASTDRTLTDAGMQSSLGLQYAEASEGDPMDGAGVYVWAGEVVLVSPTGSAIVALQQAAIIAHDTGKPVRIMVVPQAVLDNAAPRPDSFELDMKKLFGSDANSGEPGLYVTVHDGHVILVKGDEKLDLGRGETGFSNEFVLSRLSSTPGFMTKDNPQLNDNQLPGMNQGNSCVVLPN